ncbi:MAG: RHS repeat-associated core domain-containing protein [Candidatus Zixiibacteriota bacterium]
MIAFYQVTDGAKDIVWSSDYYPFGSLYDEQVVQSNELRFPGQYHDRESDLYYNWHRYYEPQLGRYVTPDPLGIGAGDVNLYRYVVGNPLSSADPSGMILEWIFDDPNERAAHKDEATTCKEFVEWARAFDYSWDEAMHSGDTQDRWNESAAGPMQGCRYMIDPANPNQVIDMRHFLVVGKHGGELAGLVNEVLQGLETELAGTFVGDWFDLHRHSGIFDAQDFLSNTLGAEFYYFRLSVWGNDFPSQLEAWCKERAKLRKCE